VIARARTLAQLSRAPAQHVRRHRSDLHQRLRELRASARRICAEGRSLGAVHMLVLGRTQTRATGSDAAKRRSDLDRLALALGAHDPERTLARGYALVEDRAGEPLGSAAAARAAGEVSLRFHDGAVPAHTEDGPGA
jgi:exodeoxyribonuclease VII large subunit